MASGLALGFATVAGAGLALMPAAPAPKSPPSDVPVQRQSNVPPPGGESVVVSSDVGGPRMKDSRLPDILQVGKSNAEINAKESTAKTSAPLDALRPAKGSNAMTVATTTDTPAPANAAAGSALTASQTTPLEPVRSVLVRPDGTPIARMSSNVDISNEALAVFVRFWLTSTPPLPDTALAAAQTKGRAAAISGPRRLQQRIADPIRTPGLVRRSVTNIPSARKGPMRISNAMVANDQLTT